MYNSGLSVGCTVKCSVDLRRCFVDIDNIDIEYYFYSGSNLVGGRDILDHYHDGELLLGVF